MVTVGDNNSGNVAGRDQVIHESYPCKGCGKSFLSKEDYQFYPYCNNCISIFRQRRMDFFLVLAVISTVLFSLWYLNNTHFFLNDIALFIHQYTKISGLLLRLISTFLPILIAFIVFVSISQFLAHFLNKRHYPYH